MMGPVEVKRDEMKLPPGMTCSDCRHLARCLALGYSWAVRTSCDFHPNRFSPISPLDIKGGES